jgi:hypothetical protein
MTKRTIQVSLDEYSLLTEIARNIYYIDRDVGTEHDESLIDEAFDKAEVWFNQYVAPNVVS